MKKSLAILLALLFVALSFNAYACLLTPPAGDMAGSSCPSSSGDVPLQFCDAFKTLALQSLPDSAHVDYRLAPTERIADLDSLAIALLPPLSQEAWLTLPLSLAIVASTVLRI